jgi:hypothetical protein
MVLSKSRSLPFGADMRRGLRQSRILLLFSIFHEEKDYDYEQNNDATCAAPV